MLRKILGTLAGVVVAMLTVSAMDGLSHYLFPGSVAKSMSYDDIAAAVAAAPLAAKAIMACGWFLAALIGGLVAFRASNWAPSGWIVAGLIFAACMINAFMIPGLPIWMWIAGVVAPLFAGLIVQGTASEA
ncbi:hypothetical protein P1X14_19975 [Sphingomonas sp. AOB5]|uniref:hypothetical protein n=1 Tax=Sphingomonas sp. AOB5 TaxID=3034017 RepID=UPI0023F6DB5F|nr:hypothetical protein [Sphingomonas sp. AOB5]MDF7777544.1 hypothetical protein [Sphingomonas sp. AOB5]